MKITALVENTTNNPALGTQHGLSFYIEANGRKILFDMGEDDLFLRNAEKLGIDISAVDLAIISHGHSDHGGGLGAFLSHNENAPVYLNRRAFGHYYTKRMPALYRLPEVIKCHIVHKCMHRCHISRMNR